MNSEAALTNKNIDSLNDDKIYDGNKDEIRCKICYIRINCFIKQTSQYFRKQILHSSKDPN